MQAVIHQDQPETKERVSGVSFHQIHEICIALAILARPLTMKHRSNLFHHPSPNAVHSLELVVVVLVARNFWLETLPLAHLLDDLTWERGLVEW